MRLALRGTLFVASLCLSLVVLLAIDLALTSWLERDLGDRMRADLRVRVALLAERASVMAAPMDEVAAWDALADRLEPYVGGRVTIVTRGGKVVGDSEVEVARIDQLENHAARPEVKAAMLGTVGEDDRLSATVHMRLRYVAAPFYRDGNPAGVVRVALPLTEVKEAVSRMHRILLLATLLALVVAVLLSSFAAAWASRAVRPLVQAARRMAAGDLETRVRPTGRDEFAGLGRVLDQLAESLSRTLGELRRERDLLGRVLDGMVEGVLVVDAQGRVALLNPVVRELWLLGADAVGQPVDRVLPQPGLLELLEKASRDGGAVSGELEVGGLKPRKLMARLLPLSGEPGARLCVFVDVTDLRRLEAMRRDFVANVSHELRTPVAAVRGAAETMRDAAARDPEAVPIFMDIIERNAERMHRLVEDLLDLSRIDAREYRLNPVPVTLSEAGEQALALFRERAGRKGITLRAELPPELRVLADPRALEQVLTNLLENAIKYCPDGASVRVRGERANDGTVRVLVMDSGPGIEPRHLARLFERFYRVDEGRARDVGGTGLGLSIVKNLVEAMGGHVGVESRPGQGATFRFTLPPA